MIFVSAGHNPYGKSPDPGAIGIDGLRECDITIEFRDLVIKELDLFGYKYITDKDSETLSQYLNRIKSGDGSVVIEYHCNAFNGKASGVETVVSDTTSTHSMRFAKEINDITASLFNLPNRGVKKEGQTARKRLALMRKEGIVALSELFFIDNIIDIEAYQKNKNQLAKEHASILIKYENLVK